MPLPKLKLNPSLVLPTVYDDTLSYYEELNKIKWYINQLIDEIGEASGMFEEINRKIAELEAAVAAIEEEIENGTLYSVGDQIALGRLIAAGVAPGSALSTVRTIDCTIVLPKNIPEDATVNFARQQISLCGSTASIVGSYLEPDGSSDSDLIIKSVTINSASRNKLTVQIGRRDNGAITTTGGATFTGGSPVNVNFFSIVMNVIAAD